jgi:hypothetical protein
MPVYAAAAGRSVQRLRQRHRWTASADCWAAKRRSAPRRRGNELTRTLRLVSPHCPRAAHGRHRRRCALPVRRMLLASTPPPGTLRIACRFCCCPSAGFLSPGQASQGTAAGLWRQGPASRRTRGGRTLRAGRLRRPQGGLGGPLCWQIAVACMRVPGQAAYACARHGAGVGWRAARGQRAPPPLAGRCAPLEVERSFTAGLCAAGHQWRVACSFP